MKLSMPTIVYLQLYQLLEDYVRELLGKFADGKNEKELWVEFANHTELHKRLFAQEFSKLHFHKKLEECGGYDDDLMPLDRNVFCDALEFIGYKPPEKVKSNKIPSQYYKVCFETWTPIFIKKYFPNKTGYVDIILASAVSKGPKSKGVKQVSSKRFETLNNSVWISTNKVGKRTDKLYFTIQTKGINEIKGTCVIRFQRDNGTYENEHETLDVTGYFLYDFLLLLTFWHQDSGKVQAGVELLDYTVDKNSLKGRWVVHPLSNPPNRKISTAKIEYTRSDIESAKKFLESHDKKR